MKEINPWVIQALLALASLPWLGSYWLAFHRGRTRTPHWHIDLLYNLGLLMNLTWVAMILAPQPRFPSLLTTSRLNTGFAWVPVLLGASLVVGFTAQNIHAMASNGPAVQRCYARPSRLLCDGAYARVRNPMNTGGLFVFLGLCLLFGASDTLVLFPCYFVLNDLFTIIEEHYALRPTFGEAFERYSTSVPRYFHSQHRMLLLCIGLMAMAQWMWLPRIR